MPGTDIDAQLRGVDDKLAGLTRDKIAATDKVYADLGARMQRTEQALEKRVDNAGVEAGNLKPWNAEEQGKKFSTDPIQAFGSLGSVFGILASAFTRNPMINALNASAAAMDAIKQGDKENYDRAYKAWEANTKQTLERHKIEQDAIQDAVSLLNTNMSLADQKLRLIGARFGDQKLLTLLEAGMNKEALEYLDAKNTLATKMQDNYAKMTLANAQMATLMSYGFDPKNPRSDESVKALTEYNKVYGGHPNIDEQWSRQWHADHPDGDSEAFAKAFGEFKRGQYGRPMTADQTFTQQFWDDPVNKELMASDPEKARQKFIDEYGKFKNQAGGNANLTTERQISAAQARKKAELLDQNPDMSETEADKQAMAYGADLRRQAFPASPNRRDDLASSIDKIGYMEDTITKVEDLLKKHKAITGLGGKITRPAEVIGNIFGSDETDRKQFERYVSELQEWAPRVLNDSRGRPLSSEAAKVGSIVAGLQLGDTAQNTARAYLELRELLGKMKTNLRERRDGSQSAPASDTTGAVDKTPARKPSWQNAPVVGQ